eukprot:symbB.v1.2.017661.t1/scaffold1378.1/size122548/5
MEDLKQDLQLQPTAEAIRIASDPRFLKFSNKRTSREQTLKCRVYEPGTELPTFMAMYGRQHCLDESMFLKSGYLGFFVRDDSFHNKLRFWHPAEICLILGTLDMIYIDEHYPIAWQHIGNSIGVPHALLLLIHALHLLGHGALSAFVVFQSFHDNKLNIGNHSLIPLDGGRLLCHKNHLPEENFVENAKLLESCKKSMDLHKHVWSPRDGFLSFDQIGIEEQLVASQVSRHDESPQEVSPTVPFQPVLKGMIRFADHVQTFWHSADLPTQVIEQNWKGKLHASLGRLEDEHTEPCMQLVPSTDDCTRSLPLILSILCDQELSLLTCPLHTPLCEIPSCQNLGFSLFDQFGIIPLTCINTWDLLILPRQLSCGIAVNDLAFTIAAFSQTSLVYQWSQEFDHCCFTVKGETPAPMVVYESLANALDNHALIALQRKINLKTLDDGLQCIFVPNSNHGVAPEGAFRLGLAIGLSRILLNQCIQGSNCVIRIKWNGRILWQDSVHPSTTVGFLSSLLGIGLFPYTLGSCFHLVNKGMRCNPDKTVADFDVSSHCGVIVLHLVPHLHGGGPGSKNQQRMMQQTALASVLLEHGYALPWTTKTCDTLLAKFSLAKIQSITAKPMGGEKLKLIHQLCQEADISIPDIAKPSSRVAAAGTPWSNSKKTKRSQIQLDPKDFTICQGFFLNEDGTAAVQLHELRPQSSGVVLASSLQAQSWIREGQLISSDELGLLILGKVPETTLPFTEVTFPCKSSNDQMVLLTAKLIQLGSKSIGFLKGSDKKIDSESCALLAITICKEDWDPESWNDALHNTQSFLRRCFAQENQSEFVLAMWGRSLRNEKAPASPAQAQTIQMHATALENKLDSLLKQSGFNKLYLTPKLQNGDPNPDFRIMWINGDLPRVTALSTQTAQCLGLVKGRLSKGYGLRFKSIDFPDAWKKIFPTTEPPKLPQGNLKFKIEGLPFGCSHQMLADWANSNNWPLTPFRTLGPQCWLVQTGQAPPPGILMFNSAPLLITQLQQKNFKSEKLITGPVPRHTPKTQKDDFGNLDPWAQWTGPRPSGTDPSTAATRKVDGPTESRFQAQDEQINSLKAEISKLSVAQEKIETTNEQRFKSVEHKVQQNALDIQNAMQQIRTDIDQTLKSTIAQQSSMVDDRFKELKELFVKTSVKRRNPSLSKEDMEED